VEEVVVDSEVAVVGLGAMGAHALWRLAARGVPALGFEQFCPGHPYGSSHGLSRLFRLAALEGPQYVPLGQLALELWRQLEQESGTTLLTTTGGLMIGPPGSETVRGTLASAQAHDLPHEVLTAADLRRRFPQHVISGSEVAVLDPAAGVLRPERAIRAAADRAVAAGARILRHVRVTGIEPGTSGVTVHTPQRSFRVGDVVVTAGAWTRTLLSAPRFGHRVQRVVMSWFEPRDDAAAQFTPSAFPVFVREVPEGGAWGAPAIDGPLVKIGPETSSGQDDDPDDIDRATYASDTAGVCRYVERYLPGLWPQPVKVQPCVIAPSPDEHFVIGCGEGLPHVIVAAGLGGHGFKYATAIGEVAASLATGEPSPVPVGAFSPSRLERPPGAAQRADGDPAQPGTSPGLAARPH
jgi:sarcosine oxidase